LYQAAQDKYDDVIRQHKLTGTDGAQLDADLYNIRMNVERVARQIDMEHLSEEVQPERTQNSS